MTVEAPGAARAVAPAAVLAVLLAAAAWIALALPAAAAEPPGAWESRGIGGGGAMFAPSFSPHDPNEIYAACDMSGLYHSTDLGASWRTLSHLQVQGGRSSMVQFTDDPDIRYVIDHSVVDGSDRARPAKSTDGGETWDVLASDPTDGEAFYLFSDPNDANRLLVSDWTRLYFSGDGGASFSEKFTFDGIHLGGVFFDGAAIFVGTSAGLLVSTDGGATFSLSSIGGIPAGKKIASFSGATSGGTTRLFALVADTAYAGISRLDYFWSHQDVYVLEWGQLTWVEKNNGLPTGSDEGMAFIATALDDIDTAYVSGQIPPEFPAVFKTTDGGDSWQNVLLTTNNENIATGWQGDGGDSNYWYGGGTLGLGVAGNDPGRIAYTDLGFIHLSTDGGTSWRQAYVHPDDANPAGQPTPKGLPYRGIGMENTSCWQVAWIDAQHLWACFADIGGVRSTDGGTSWSFDYSGFTENSSYKCIRHPGSGLLYLATSTVHDLYQSTYLQDSRIDSGDGRVLYSPDLGETWLVLHDFDHPVIDIALDPSDADTLYASVVHSAQGDIYVTHELDLGGAATWSRLGTPPRTEGHPFKIHVLDDGTLVSTYSGRRDAGGSFTDSSGVFVSTDGGASWIDRSHENMHYWVKDLVIDPHDPGQDTWYVGVWSGWGGPWKTNNNAGGLYRSTDRGLSWERIIHLHRVGSCTVNPDNGDELYMTTEWEGLWHCDDLTSGAPTFEQVPGYPFRHPERVFFNPHEPGETWVASFGNGMRVGRRGHTVALACVPSSGTLPFSSLLTVTMANHYSAAIRTIAASIDVALASGALFSNWRAGSTNIAPGGDFVRSLSASLPAVSSVIGTNTFTLTGVDVTPPPYNQPPYPPSGAADTDTCTVEGIAP